MENDHNFDIERGRRVDYFVLPFTTRILTSLAKRRRDDALQKSKDAGEAAAGGDGWHSSTYRILQDEMWVLADLQRTADDYYQNSDTLPEPLQFELIEQGHSVQLSLRGNMKSEYGMDSIVAHLVSTVDVSCLKDVLAEDTRFNENEGGNHFLVSIDSPLGKSIVGKSAGENISFLGADGENFKAKIENTDNLINPIQLSILFDYGQSQGIDP